MAKLFVLFVLTVIAAGYTHANRHEIARGSPLQDITNHAAAGMPGRQGPFSHMSRPSGRGHHRRGHRGHGMHSIAASRGQTGSSGMNRLAQLLLTNREKMGSMDGESPARHHQRMMENMQNMRTQMSRQHQMSRRVHDLRRPGQGRRGQGRREPMRTAGSTNPRAAIERLGFAPTGGRHGRRGGMRHGMRGHRIGSHGIGGHGIGGHGMRGHGHRRGEGRHGIHMMRRGYGLGPHNTVA